MSKTDVALIEQRIYTIRGVRVILDSDLAALYGVYTKRLNEQYRRNRKRFPEDFAFQLTAEEADSLRSQIATSSDLNRSQIATGSQKHRDPRYRPYAFTEHGALQAANILNSANAVRMSVFVIRAFVKIREQLVTNAAILKRLAEIDKTLLVHDSALRDLYQKLLPLLSPPPEPPRRRIGFHQP
jgi:ORF6N domain-containing protein